MYTTRIFFCSYGYWLFIYFGRGSTRVWRWGYLHCRKKRLLGKAIERDLLGIAAEVLRHGILPTDYFGYIRGLTDDFLGIGLIKRVTFWGATAQLDALY